MKKPRVTFRIEYALAAAIAAYVLLVSWVSGMRLASYDFADFDLAVHSQSMASILRGSLDSSILGVPFLGNHMVLILFLLAPFYALWPGPLLLLVAQSAALGAGAWCVYAIARRELPATWAAGLSLLYLVYPPLISLNLYEFHPVAFAVPLLLAALACYQSNRYGGFLACLALAMSCQENIALIAVGFSLYALVDRRSWRWVAVPFAAGALCFAVTVLWVMPHLNPSIQFMKLYGHLGRTVPEALTNLVRHPVFAAKSTLSLPKLAFLSALLAPLAYLSLLRPARFLPVALVLAQRLLSSRTSEVSVAYHYQAEFIPFLFFAAAGGLGRIMELRWSLARRGAAAALVGLTTISLFASGIPNRLAHALTSSSEARRARESRDRAVALVPPDAAVLATFQFLPRLSRMERIYSFHHVYDGRYTLSDLPYPTPAVDTILMDAMDPLTFSPSAFYHTVSYQHIQPMLTNGNWSLVYQADSVLLFRQGPETALPPSLVDYPDPVPAINTNAQTSAGSRADIALAGFTLAPRDEDGYHALTLFWRTPPGKARDVEVRLTLRALDGTVFDRRMAPGSRIWPPQSWPPDAWVADHHRVRLRSEPAVGIGELSLSATLLPMGQHERR